jgi:hypothetical protein
MSSDVLAMLALFLVPVSLYIIPTFISRLLIEPDRRWSSDGPLLFVFFALWFLSLTIRPRSIFNWLLEPALLTTAPITFWLMSTHRLVTRLKVGDQPVGSQLLLILVGVSVLLLFPLVPSREGFP